MPRSCDAPVSPLGYRVLIALANSFEHFHACAHDIGTVGLGQLDAHDEKGKQDTRGALDAE